MACSIFLSSHFPPCLFILVHSSVDLHFTFDYFFYTFLSFDFQRDVIARISSPDSWKMVEFLKFVSYRTLLKLLSYFSHLCYFHTGSADSSLLPACCRHFGDACLQHAVKFIIILDRTEMSRQYLCNFSVIGLMRKKDVCTDLSICDCSTWKPGNNFVKTFPYFMWLY